MSVRRTNFVTAPCDCNKNDFLPKGKTRQRRRVAPKLDHIILALEVGAVLDREHLLRTKIGKIDAKNVDVSSQLG